jgi:hypothetical protein
LTNYAQQSKKETTMPDHGTMKDHIEDLMQELEALRAQRDSYASRLFETQYMMRQWRRSADAAFTFTGGCIAGCRGACMCTCGYEHYRAAIAQEEKQNK